MGVYAHGLMEHAAVVTYDLYLLHKLQGSGRRWRVF